MTALAEKVTDRLQRARRQLSGLITEVLAHVSEADDNALIGPLIGVGIQAAELAAILGFPTPPIEHSLAAPDERHAFFTSPYGAGLAGIRLHTPDGHHSFELRVTPPGSVDMKARVQKESSMWAARWQRNLDRLRVCDIRHSLLDIREDELSIEGVTYSWQLHHEILGKDFSASEEVKLLRPDVWHKITEQAWEARRAALDRLSKRAVQDENQDSPAHKRDIVESTVSEKAAVDESPRSSSRDTQSSVTCDEANQKARKLLKTVPGFEDKTQKEWAEAIGCSEGLVAKLPVRKAVMEERRKNKPLGAPKAPAAISLSNRVLATVGEDNDPAKSAEIEETMQRLIAEAKTPEEKERLENLTPEQRRRLAEVCDEQQRDAELNPLEDERSGAPPRQVKTRKRL